MTLALGDNKNALAICQRALADIGTRSTITSVFPPDGSNESALCVLYYNNVLLQLLRAARWSFATRTDALTLWKALPGTPENPTAATVSGWSRAYPAPPWTYSYVYPTDCVRAHYLIGQPQQVPIAPPIFSGSTGTNPPVSQRLPMARFEVATDLYDANGNAIYGISTSEITVVTAGTGYGVGDHVYVAGGTLSAGSSYAPQPAQGAVVQVTETNPQTGAVIAVEALTIGAYTTPPTNPCGQQAGPGGTAGTGMTFNAYWPMTGQQVILTQQEFPLLTYTYWSNNEPLMDDMFVEAFVSAMAGRLAFSLTGDKALSRDKLTIANEHIINARVADGNEGLTINDHIPDWIRVRGAGGALGYEAFFYPLGPLFPVAPLV